MTATPKLSVITVNLNNSIGLQKTFDSVFQQAYKDYEFIVIDGDSVDDSKAIIAKYTEKISSWKSEKDRGIYHAMNKGVKTATGEYLLFLNSGDALNSPDTLLKVAPFLKSTDIVYGNLLIKARDKEWVKYYSDPLSFEYFTRDTLPHQASFIKRNLFHSIGLYDETLKIVSDWKFFLLAICRFQATTLYIDKVVADYDFSGISSVAENFEFQQGEKRLVLEEEFPLFTKACLELQEYRKKKEYYDSFKNDPFVRKYFALKLKIKAIKKLLIL